jgi:hypothetical protein
MHRANVNKILNTSKVRCWWDFDLFSDGVLAVCDANGTSGWKFSKSNLMQSSSTLFEV